MLDEEHMIVRETAKYWWLFLVAGIAWLILAWLVLRMNVTSIKTVGVLLGVVFLFAAITEVGLAAMAHGGWKVWHVILAVIFFLGALWGFIEPVDTFFALKAWADAQSLARAAARNLPSPAEVLARNDSFHFFSPLGDTVRTGRTDTNVGDLQVLLVTQ